MVLAATYFPWDIDEALRCQSNESATSQPDRVVPIAERFGMDPGVVLGNIIYACAYTYEHQYNLLLGLAAKMAKTVQTSDYGFSHCSVLGGLHRKRRAC
ncbi:DNA repair (Rad51) family protein [Trifolium repens]|nr:DNA repair (Rad51) family protein [Trifolium repens]